MLKLISAQVTNASGGLNPDYEVGDIVVLNDVSISRILSSSYDIARPRCIDLTTWPSIYS